MVLSLAPKFTKLRALILSQDKPQLDDNAVETIANIVMIYMTSWLLGFVDVEKRHLTRPLSVVELTSKILQDGIQIAWNMTKKHAA
ncbi:hypothetical protein Tco_1422013 [Tanacetum coccineum]